MNPGHGLEHPSPGRSRTATGPRGLEHPGGRSGKRTNARNPDWNIWGRSVPADNRATRTATSGGQKPWTGTSGEEASGPGLECPGLHKEEEAAAARKGKENMNKTKERMREDTKNMNRDEREEGGEGAAQKETTDNQQIKKEKHGRHGATDGNNRGQEEPRQQRGPLDWNIQGDAEASGQAHGARTAISGEERTGRQHGMQHSRAWCGTPS